jgi:hypothetical protein
LLIYSDSWIDLGVLGNVDYRLAIVDSGQWQKLGRDLFDNLLFDLVKQLEQQGQYIGVSFDTHEDMESYVIPEQFGNGDFTYVLADETKSGATTRYIIEGAPDNKYFAFAYIINDVPRDFSTNPIQSGELANGAVDDDKIAEAGISNLSNDSATDTVIGKRTLTDQVGSDTLVAIGAKTLLEWLQGIRNNLKSLFSQTSSIDTALQSKVDVEEGKGLSTNDFSDDYKKSLDGQLEAYIYKPDDETIIMTTSRLLTTKDTIHFYDGIYGSDLEFARTGSNPYTLTFSDPLPNSWGYYIDYS